MADYPKDIEKNQHSTGDLLQSNAGLSHPDSSRMGNEASEDKSFSESRYGESEDNADKSSQVSQGKNSHPKLRLMIRFAIGLLLFSVVLACVTFSKLTLIRLTDQLRNLTVNTNVTSKAENASIVRQAYWQLLFVMVLPHCLTFVRSAVVGVIGKTRKLYPWPSKRAIIVGVVSSIVEVIAMSFFVFSVLSYLTPDLTLLTMQGVFLVQFLLDIYYMPSLCKCNHHHRSSSRNSVPGDENGQRAEHDVNVEDVQEESCFDKVKLFFQHILENKQIKLLAFLLQILGIGGLLAIIVVEAKVKSEIYLFPVIGLPLCITTLSFLWSNKMQGYLITPKNGVCDPSFNARYKANFINSAVRTFFFPFVTYGVFRGIHYDKDINPWSGLDPNFLGTGEDLSFFLTQVLTSFFGYVFSWIACTMTLHTFGFAFPLLLSTPVALVVTYCSSFYPAKEHFNYVAFCVWFAIYIGQLLGMAYFLCTKNNLILSQDKDMFINPHYDGVFLEQYLILNRQVEKYKVTESTVDGPPKSRRAIFICSTMFRETVREMRQLLVSIMGIAQWHDKQVRRKGQDADLIESHIFFDGALSGGQLTQYALQLLSLVKETLGENVTNCLRKEELYGQSMSWDIGGSQMKFTVHFKDSFKVKKKKRWSQVMYMNYIIKYRIPQSLKESDKNQSPNKRNKKDHLDIKNTFILTTDADICFTAESAMLLLDSLTSNKEVGAVCARTHPKGSGVMYWYQVFDYAVGHWFWKPAEHFFGCVLCCPGCFSVFRCSALATVLKEYSSEVKGATDFLTKDMGEDRWLCTLLIQSGWRLDYCAISKNYTYCPESFDEFYKQRRRWAPSTMANLLLLVSKARDITKANNSVSMLFIVLQTIVAFSTVISPATVILLIASGLQGAYHLSNGTVLAIIIVLSMLSILYGLVCLYTSQKAQIDLAKSLTLLFAIVMAVVVVGIFKQIIFEIFPGDDGLKPSICLNTTILHNSDCTNLKDNLEIDANMSAYFSSTYLPTSPTSWYIAVFAVTFTVAALLHPGEWTGLVHSIWYLLALPSGYLLLLIYSAANLDSQSWGTREAAVKAGGGFTMTKKWFRTGVTAVQNFLKEKKLNEQKFSLLAESEPDSATSDEEPAVSTCFVNHKQMNEEARVWLEEQDCIEEQGKFEEHGYWNLSFIASMTQKEFRAIGIKQLGYVLRLEKAAKELPAMVIETKVPRSIPDWLTTLQMEEYTEVFRRAGFSKEEDVENLKKLNERELNRMGVVKMAHVKRLMQAWNSLFHPTNVEVQIYQAKKDVKNIQAVPVQDEESLNLFWKNILSKELKPVTFQLQQMSTDIGQKLKSLRNTTLAVGLLINIMWIILLYTVTFPHLKTYNLPEKAFQLLFLAVYGLIIVISFVAMLAHRCIMLMHFLGRQEIVTETVAPNHKVIVNPSFNPGAGTVAETKL